MSTRGPAIQRLGDIGSTICSPDVAGVGASKEHETRSDLNWLAGMSNSGVQRELLFVPLRHGWWATTSTRVSTYMNPAEQKDGSGKRTSTESKSDQWRHLEGRNQETKFALLQEKRRLDVQLTMIPVFPVN